MDEHDQFKAQSRLELEAIGQRARTDGTGLRSLKRTTDRRRGPEGPFAVTPPLTGNRAALLLPDKTVRRRRNLDSHGSRRDR
jgi:hypothetical protein